MVKLDPGAAVEHVERWRLHDGVQLSADEASINAALSPILHDIKAHTSVPPTE
jgi:DNA-binding GntR family transcriptional regulator